MTPEELQAIRELVNKATPGPWRHDDRSGCTAVRTDETNGLNRDHEDVICFSNKGAKFDGMKWTMDEQTRLDFAFIAWCREGVPRLLDEIERLRGALAELANHRLSLDEDWNLGYVSLKSKAQKALEGGETA